MNGPTRGGGSLRPGSWRAIRIVSAREFTTRFQSKAWRATTGLILVIVVGVSLLIKLVGAPGSAVTVGVTPSTQPLAVPLTAIGKAVGVTIDAKPVASESAGRAAVSSGAIDALLTGDGTSVSVVVKDKLDTSLENSLNVLARELVTQQEITKLGGDPAAFSQAVASAKVDVVSLNPPKTYDEQHLLLGILTGILIFMTLQLGGQTIAQGVVEEKSTRVVELLLSTVRPWELIAGKVLGLGALGLLQLVVIAGGGVAAAEATGTLTLGVPSAVGTLVWLLVWFVLGFFAYALALAAAAALVSRQEDVGTVMMPVLSFLIIGYVLGVSVLPHAPDDTAIRVLSMLPPFAPALMPIRLAIGAAPVIDVVIAVFLMLLTIPGLALLSGRIYRNAVMRTGARVRLRDALRTE